MRPHEKTYALYRIYDDNDCGGLLLYVGATTNPGMRFDSHSRTQPWWPTVTRITVQHFRSFDKLAAAEVRAIENEEPIYNRMHTDTPWAGRPRRRGEPRSVFQRADGMWMGSVELPPGPGGKRRQKRVYSKDRAAAELKLAALREAVAMGDIS